jgi:hypothetical protein
MASLKAKQGSSMTHGDANENDDVLACPGTAAFWSFGPSGSRDSGGIGSAADADGTAGAQYA